MEFKASTACSTLICRAHRISQASLRTIATSHNMGSATKTKKDYPQFFKLDPQVDHMTKSIEPTISGTIPKWLSGSLFRNGSGIYHMGNDSWNHLFDGFAVVHRWTVNDGKVTFQQSVLDTETYKKSVKHNRLIGMSFGSNFPDPCKSLFSKAMSYFIPEQPGDSDNTGVNIVEFGDKLFAMTETTCINEIKPEEISVKSKVELKDALTVHMGTAHPIKSRDNKEMYYYGTHMNYKQAYNFIKIPLTDDKENPFAGAQVMARVPSRWKMNISYTHAFGMTDNYFVHIEQPMTMNLPKMITLSMTKSCIAEAITCQENEPIRVILVHKDTGKVVPLTYEAPHGFVFHFGNCYEEDNQVVCDVALFNDGKVIKSAYIEEINKAMNDSNPQTMIEAEFSRFVMPLSIEGAKPGQNLITLKGSNAKASLRAGTKDVVDIVSDQQFDSSYKMELPKYNEAFMGLKNRYTYATNALASGDRRAMKFDCQEKTVKEYSCNKTHVIGETVFVARPGAVLEDDGILMIPVVAVTEDAPTFLAILDAATFTELGRASVPTGMKVSFTFHGFFTDKKNLSGL